ncbi:uncharacterized protein LOC8029750 isoform X1 [Ixodes scapularis]|uniref:uncharacterized protein LOC8029750 isoform X1 n=1 Tax=Ixodes scapularis TaxID=6945 RepID=UPI001C38BAFB|nr:uncharacterized protein LOC8029750 isoform X1 [Ixodes scapularis]
MPITITQQSTTMSSSGERLSLCALNLGYLKTLDGWIKIAQVILGLIVMSLLVKTYQVSWVLFLMMTAFAFAVISLLILISAMGSLSGGTLMGTLFYLNYHIVGFIFYLSGGLTCVINASQYTNLGIVIAAGSQQRLEEMAYLGILIIILVVVVVSTILVLGVAK